MSTLDAGDLEEFVRYVDEKCGGDLNHPEALKYYPIHFQFVTEIDEGLDPFSDKYYSQQLQLYEEISGRKIDQWSGELHPIDVPGLFVSANPLGITNPRHISEHVRALSTMLSLSCLDSGAKILDMGAGHGLSSEVFAYCGCEVHAVDIDPRLGELSQLRSTVRNLPITRYHLNFDDLSQLPDAHYQAAFFFQSLHHCLKPWELIASLKTKLLEGGIVAFTGEPIQSTWKNWGLRLDHESLYVARAYGWFESGWSRDFIEQCFIRNGMSVTFFEGGHGGGLIGIASDKAIDEVRGQAALIGLRMVGQGAASGTPRYSTQIGHSCRVQDIPGFSADGDHGEGFLLYGPYLNLEPGTYDVSLFMLSHDGEGGAAKFDVVAERGKLELYAGQVARSGWVHISIELSEEAHDVETRVFLSADSRWACTFPEITRRQA